VTAQLPHQPTSGGKVGGWWKPSSRAAMKSLIGMSSLTTIYRKTVFVCGIRFIFDQPIFQFKIPTKETLGGKFYYKKPKQKHHSSMYPQKVDP